MLKIHNVEQGSQEWFDLRKLKLTASHAQAVATAGAGLDTYVTEMLAHHFAGTEKDYYSGTDTKRGNELEPVAREMYELETGNKVEQVGFIELNEYIGSSPDGLVGDDGGIEIKCCNDVIHFEMMRDMKPEKKHLWQVQMNLLITERKWWDLIFFNPNHKKSLIKIRVLPDMKMFESLKLGLAKGTEMIKSQINKNYNG